MKKSLKVLLLSSVTLLLVACMDQAEDPAEVSSSSEATEEVVSESLVEDDVAEDVSDAESSQDDVEADEASDEVAEDVPEDDASESQADEAISEDEAEVSEDADSSLASVVDEESDDTEEAEEEIEAVVVDMVNQDGDSMGTATFEEAANGVILTLELEGLEAGEYGFHIHEYGQATPPTFMDALGHFNPTGAKHGIHSEGGPHMGDFPNLVVGKDGKVNVVLVVSNVSLDPEAPYTLRTENGTSLIIHEGIDDYETQPIGTSGYGMIGGVIFAPISEEPEQTDDETAEDESSDEADAESSDESSKESSEESSETDSSEDESEDSKEDESAESSASSDE